MLKPTGLTVLAVTVLTMEAVSLLGAPPGKGKGKDKELTPAQQKELTTLTGQLADPSRSAKTKLEAAELLLAKPYPQAIAALKDFLAGDNQAARIAVAEAIARTGDPDKSFIEPLLAMLTGEESALHSSAARALATCKNHGITEKLVSIVLDRKRAQSVRVATISALQLVLDKRTVDALVRLLDDSDSEVRDAAADALAKLTNIKAFRTNRRLAKQWWAKNKDRAPSEWLAALADSLARSKAELEAGNARLRERLAQALRDQYNATAPAQRAALLLGFLGDPLPDVRLVGANLVEAEIAAGRELADKVRTRVRSMLTDADPRARKASALLIAQQGDAGALQALMDGLKKEEVPDVQEAILTALGQLRKVEALDVVLAEIVSKYDQVAAAAARALGRIASDHPLKGDQLTRAVNSLLKRYRRRRNGLKSVPLHEAILGAMGVLGQKEFVPVLRGGLKDDEATVRLAAVNALARLGRAEDGDSIAALVGDPDRGVRRAAIAALGTLGGRSHLQIILQRTGSKTEPDEAVRKQAWEVAMRLLAGADAKTLDVEARRLADRPDAVNQRIRILEMLVSALKTKKSDRLPQALRRLGVALVDASRAAEAAGHLRAAYEALAAAKDETAVKVWGEWVAALLSADDPSVIPVMADQSANGAFAAALKQLTERLEALMKAGKFAPVVLLAGKALEQLPQRLTVEQRNGFQKVLADARAGRRQADRKRVSQLVDQLTAADEAARDKARAELQSMGDRAVIGLLETLKSNLEDEEQTRDAEQAIIAMLKQIAPKLTGYDSAAEKADRIKVVEAWLKSRTS